MTSLDFCKLCLLAYCLVLFVQLLSPLSCSAFASATTTEAEALLKRKATFQNHTRVQNLTSWTYLPAHTKAASCFWIGISCNAVGSISAINLTNFGIQGTLHEFSFLSFPNLQYLNLSHNNFSGVIPAQINSLSKLIYLDVSNNWLSGSNPTSLGALTNITFLYLYRNNLSSTIPKEIGKLKSLVDLELSHNQLNGSIPTSLGQLTNLNTLYLHINNLSEIEISGFIPSSFEGMHGLSYVDVSYNELEGPLPNNKAFGQALPEALQGNKGLCGNVEVQRKKKRPEKAEKNLHEEISFSVLNFDGKSMYEEIIRAIGNFDSTYCIGSGAQGSVCRANLSSDNIAAVKKLHQLWDGEKNLETAFLTEIRALTVIRHRNIAKLYGFCSHHRHSFLVYEFVERGSLATILSKDEEAKEVGWRKRVNIVKGLILLTV